MNAVINSDPELDH